MSNLTAAERLYSQPNAFTEAHPQRYKYSFSGADARVYAFFPQRPDLISALDSVHTISISVHEAKAQARSLGYRGTKGLTRSTRTIAGSMILTVVNDHPLRSLIQQYNTMILESNLESANILSWSIDQDETGVGHYNDIFSFENRLAALLPPFHLMIQYVAEQAPIIQEYIVPPQDPSQGPIYPSFQTDNDRLLFPGAGLLLQYIEVIDESIVTSVNDIVSEITLSYIARDFKPIAANTYHDGGKALTQTEMAIRQYDLYKLCYPAPPPGAVTTLNSELQ